MITSSTTSKLLFDYFRNGRVHYERWRKNMSNPGVITHESLVLSSNMPVKIEDNLGKCTHSHWPVTFRHDT